MGVWEILLIVGAVLVVAGVIIAKIIAHKKGGVTCDGTSCMHDCAHCAEFAKEQERLREAETKLVTGEAEVDAQDSDNSDDASQL